MLPPKPWARASNNVKKPQSQMCESCRKNWFKIFVKQNWNIFGLSHTFDSVVCYCTNKFQQGNKTKIKFEVSLHFWWIWPTVRRQVGRFDLKSSICVMTGVRPLKRSLKLIHFKIKSFFPPRIITFYRTVGLSPGQKTPKNLISKDQTTTAWHLIKKQNWRR